MDYVFIFACLAAIVTFCWLCRHLAEVFRRVLLLNRHSKYSRSQIFVSGASSDLVGAKGYRRAFKELNRSGWR